MPAEAQHHDQESQFFPGRKILRDLHARLFAACNRTWYFPIDHPCL
ncbi:hypothetical protein BN2476_1510009 [Paraburkholderia piptadeniae]|uniref:Uncharacterized protein n=1 Tax=Paraburkholderia piptadeniae TaxID=1701573 RepID=A0A1N7SX05_9BURK|nr:hypothetical protein BN2476_1510009 [Paraburkholderia piptadeniae]